MTPMLGAQADAGLQTRQRDAGTSICRRMPKSFTEVRLSRHPELENLATFSFSARSFTSSTPRSRVIAISGQEASASKRSSSCWSSSGVQPLSLPLPAFTDVIICCCSLAESQRWQHTIIGPMLGDPQVHSDHSKTAHALSTRKVMVLTQRKRLARVASAREHWRALYEIRQMRADVMKRRRRSVRKRTRQRITAHARKLKR